MKKFIALDAKEYDLMEGIVPISLSWDTKTIKGWCDKVTMTKEDIIIGHSIGAAVAIMVASKTPPKELHLYSPTPIFFEFLELYKKYPTKEKEGRFKEFIPIPNVDCPVFVYIGGDEDPFMKVGARVIAESMKNSTLKTIPGKDHMTIIPDSIANMKNMDWGE